MAYVYSLNVAADFGEMMGQSSVANQYRQLAETIKVNGNVEQNTGFDLVEPY